MTSRHYAYDVNIQIAAEQAEAALLKIIGGEPANGND